MEAVSGDDSDWLARLRATHGADRVVDVIAESGENLKNAAQTLQFGMHVVRKAVSDEVLNTVEAMFPKTFEDIRAEWGVKKTLVGSTQSPFYHSWQAVGRGCTCKYKYDSTAQHPVMQVGKQLPDHAGRVQPKSVSQLLDHVLQF